MTSQGANIGGKFGLLPGPRGLYGRREKGSSICWILTAGNPGQAQFYPMNVLYNTKRTVRTVCIGASNRGARNPPIRVGIVEQDRGSSDTAGF
jgi:hypothetical protein